MKDIKEVIKILSNPEVIYRSKIKNIGSISFESAFRKDNIIIKIDEKLDFDWDIYPDVDDMTEEEKNNMKDDYKKAKSVQKHESICISRIKER